jgi:transcriptional regulator with XRE-family HTH domain
MFRFRNKTYDFGLRLVPLKVIIAVHRTAHFAFSGKVPGATTREDHTMERAGARLRRTRERLKLTYRDVEQASQVVAGRRGNEEYAIPISRLADIENKGTLPSIYRLYTLTVVYRLSFEEVLGWYGVPLDCLAADALHIRQDATHAVELDPRSELSLPLALDGDRDLTKTHFLSHLLRRWGKLPVSLIRELDFRRHRYGYIGLEDWSMYPLLAPGSLLMIEERRKFGSGGWTSEFDRPIYFLEQRDAYVCGWCTLEEGRLVVQSHPSSHQGPRVFAYPGEIELVGQVVGVAMLLDAKKRLGPRGSGVPTTSSNP